MLVHIVADDQNKISELRALFGSQDRITSALLNDESKGPKECDAMIVAVDLRNADNIAALMAQPDIDGALVGGASLEADDFARIVRWA